MQSAERADPIERARPDSLSELTNWLAGNITALRIECYETVIDAALSIGEDSNALNGMLTKKLNNLKRIDKILRDDMLLRYEAIGVSISPELEVSRHDVLEVIGLLSRVLGEEQQEDGDPPSGRQIVEELRSICFERMQPATTIFMTQMHALEGVQAAESLAEKQKYVLSAIGGIERVASRITLIAINVAIEANRSGEAGSAFSVIAREIQDLARRASDATEEITRRIRS